MASWPGGEHTAIVTGANQGIGAAAAVALSQRGCAVLCTFLRVDDPVDPGVPQAYRDHRAQDWLRAESRQGISQRRGLGIGARDHDPQPRQRQEVEQNRTGGDWTTA